MEIEVVLDGKTGQVIWRGVEDEVERRGGESYL